MKMLDSPRMHWESLQQSILNTGPSALRSMGYEFSPIDNNPRHGFLSRKANETLPSAEQSCATEIRDVVVEVVERCGLWWVLPTRPFRFV
jgi:hypothetical protein